MAQIENKNDDFYNQIADGMRKPDNFTTLEALELMSLKKKFLVESGTLDNFKKEEKDQPTLHEWFTDNFEGFCVIAAYILNKEVEYLKGLKAKDFEVILDLVSWFLQEVETPDFFTNINRIFLQLIKL